MNLKQVLNNLSIIFAIALVFIYLYKRQDVDDSVFIKGPYPVQTIQVIQGHEFDITYSNGRLHGKLPVSTPPEAKLAIARLLNDSTNPKLYLLSKSADGDFWFIKLVVLNEAKEVDLESWLKAKNLAWDK